MVDSSDSNSGYFEIRHNRNPMKRKHYIIDDDEEEEDISGKEAMLKRRKQPKKNTMPLVSSSPTSKMICTKNNELVILKGILEYEKEKGISYGSDWDDFYGYVKDLINADFSKKQLINEVKKLKMRFSDTFTRSKDGKELVFTFTDDEQVFRFSMIIWGKNETESASNEDIQDQPKEVLVWIKDVPCEENEPESYMRKEKEEKFEKENMQNQPKEVLVWIKDVPCEENNPGSYTRMEKAKECEEEDGVDEFCVLQDALEAVTVYQTFGKNQKKLLCRNLKNLSAQRKKELTDKWKALLDEEMKLSIKKLTFSAKLANANTGVSA